MISGEPTVLVVEDEPELRKVAKEWLTGEGCFVLEASSTGEALALIENHNVEVLFTDVKLLGRINGLELARHVASWHHGIEVILTSAAINLPSQSSSPAFSYLPKPYSLPALSEMIREKMARRS